MEEVTKGAMSMISLNEKAVKRSRYFYPIAVKLAKSLKTVEMYLYQAEVPLNIVEYIAYSLYVSFSFTLFFALGIIVLFIITSNTFFIKISLLIPLVFLMSFYTQLYKPRVYALRKARRIEEELPYALRHMLIQIRSGVPLYNTLVSLTRDYGELSGEFKKIIKKINTGYSESKALEESILKSASDKYRKSFWQILNALRTGTNIDKPLENVVNEIVHEQILSIKEYGRQLNPLTLMYMMIAVIMPSLGITFLMIISSFAGFSLNSGIFAMILLFLVFFQWGFLNLIKNKRPSIKI